MKDKLLRALKHKAVLAERSKLLRQQVEDFRTRESSMNHIASELLQRQRELNYMLHRASSVLHQMQDTNLALSAEFTHLVKELPAPRENEGGTSEWEETMSRVNDLFHRTHELAGEMQDEIFRTTTGPVIPDPTKDVSAVTTSVTSEPQGESPTPEPPVEIQNAQTPSAQRPVPLLNGGIEAVEAEVVEETLSAPEAEPEIVEITIMQPESEADSTDGTQQEESADELFRRLNAAASDLRWPDDEPAVRTNRKPSLLARIFGKGDEE
jgi:hypothetical protein